MHCVWLQTLCVRCSFKCRKCRRQRYQSRPNEGRQKEKPAMISVLPLVFVLSLAPVQQPRTDFESGMDRLSGAAKEAISVDIDSDMLRRATKAFSDANPEEAAA